MVLLHNGVAMPVLQLGTAQLITRLAPDLDAPPNFVGMQPERGYRQIELALQAGMRAFDTALIYRSHTPLSHVLGEWFRTGRLTSRHEVWITSKIFHPPSPDCFGVSHMSDFADLTVEQISDRTRRDFERALDELNVGYIDLMLLHWPGMWPNTTNKEDDSSNRATSSTMARQKRLAAWRVLEDMYEMGWCRAIGVSNFDVRHLQQLQEDGAKILPMVNQIEASVEVQSVPIRDYCLQHGIVLQAYSTLRGTVHRTNATTAMPRILQDLQAKYHKDVGQLGFRYLYQHGYTVVYLTNSAARLTSNTQLWDFELTADEVHALDALNDPENGGWGLPNPNQFD